MSIIADAYFYFVLKAFLNTPCSVIWRQIKKKQVGLKALLTLEAVKAQRPQMDIGI